MFHASGPLMRTTATPPRPGGVDKAQIVEPSRGCAGMMGQISPKPFSWESSAALLLRRTPVPNDKTNPDTLSP